MGKFHHMIISIVFFVTIALLSDQVHSSSPVVIRVPRSIGGIIRRLINGRRKQTGFQGTAQVQSPYAFGSYGQASSLYPSYSPYSSLYPGYSYYPSGYGPAAYQSAYGSYPSAALAAAATSQYPAYSPPYASPSSYSSSYASPSTYGSATTSSTGTLDIHQVLDQLVRSAGLSPSGEHDPQATLQAKGDSSFAQSGTTPVFSFKKLYSFPFYVSSADQSSDGGYNVPFMKRHIKRMSAEAQQQQQQQQLQQIQQIQQLQLLKQIEPLITMRMAQIQDQKKEQQQSPAQQSQQSVSQSVSKATHQEYSSAQDVDQSTQ